MSGKLLFEEVDISNICTCKSCGYIYGDVIESGQHKKLICSDCGKYIKMLSTNEYKMVQSDNEMKDSIDIEEEFRKLNFKLDLIIDHLGIGIRRK